MTAVLLELLQHKTWATLTLLDYCLTLPAEHLEATLPGTYGSVTNTLRHLVQADQNFYRMLTGTDIGPLPGEDAGLAPVAERFRELSERWEAVMLDPTAAERDTRNRFGTAKGVAPLA